MKLCTITDSIGHLDYEAAAKAAAELGIEALEIGTGNWNAAPHLDLEALLASGPARKAFLDVLKENGLELAALNCSGNQLHPVDGARQTAVIYDTVRLAGLLGCDTVVLMSGLPGGGPEDRHPNWITCAWPPECGDILHWQWNEKLIPWWTDLARHGEEHGIRKFCIEMHGNQLVHNVPTLLRLREAVGPIVGANLDPSHLFWMGADPLAAIPALGDAIFHVHAKDTAFVPRNLDLTGRLETTAHSAVAERAWNYVTLGYGHDPFWWKTFCYQLRLHGYDGYLSIEHEDSLLSRMEGMRRSVEVLQAAMLVEASDYTMPGT